MNLLCSLFACVIMFELCAAASHFHHQSFRHSTHKRKSHGHTLQYGLVKMPSGSMSNITKPYKSSHFKCGQHARRINLDPHGNLGRHEYNVVKKEVVAGAIPAVQVTITKIEKILNPCLWSKYWYRKQQVRSEATDPNEMMLFHYSTASDNYIIDSGFDERYAKMGDYGAGLYFTSSFTKAQEKSKPKSNGNRNLLLCRVTLGKSSEMDSKVLAHAPVGFQSVKRQGSEDYVIYRGEQAYPEYLITYRI